MASSSLPPFAGSAMQLFIKSQFRTECIPPPSSTTFSGKTAVVTGSNCGIGLEACRVLLEHQLSHIILGVRSPDKGQDAAAPLRKAHPNAKIEVWQLDMLSYESVRAFAKGCSALPRLDIAILNAGIGAMDFVLNQSTGHEEMLQVNYLSTALLSILLVPVLKSKPPQSVPGRLLLVASGLALLSKFPNRNADPLIPTFNDGNGWNMAAAAERYNVTKTMVLMLVQKLGEVVNPNEVIITAVDPGFTGGSNLNRSLKGLAQLFTRLIKKLSARSLREAAWTYIDAITREGTAVHGSFVMDWEIHPFHEMMYETEGKQTAERLWVETLNELEFAGVKDIILSTRKTE
ncbi:hypothetical protein FDECE_11358 [Fusarium decemcellulare]|nr:hypothetical protein FDECE_11358 [Fusarium decemcellulare]